MRFFGKKEKIPDEDGINKMLQNLEVEYSTENEQIENFLSILGKYIDYKTLNMTLKEFMEHLNERHQNLSKEISNEDNTLKIRDMFEELANLDEIKQVIYWYIQHKKPSQDDFSLSLKDTTLTQFIKFLNSRQKYLYEVLNKK